ncbi:NAD(+) synthase [Alkaliphilus serpentinus]|uniref:NH(3)-dependent NAD(+) synthetase n=1 Tax=Alkaliphilus serpentinus TaxID=1482731 RepID=A0A833HQ35_9FIRM|nr:NAD(+) synthase [Alkaliphilus serpentinus]KAB3531462.1 NAD(+) synthase [Alkaliphilus serpentinus]
MDIENRIDKVVEWLREKVKVSGTKGLLVGISGGIDSAVVANLIKKAFPENSLGVILPIKSNPKDVEDGLLLVKQSGITHIIIDLSPQQQEMLALVNKTLQALNLFNEGNNKLTDANLRARLRMSTLYALANQLNYLVVGTDNAAEVYTGYFTKYGDGGVDLLPIATLKKYEVYQWAKALGVPQEILDRQPSAGLWEGQTDEAEMGTTYKAIDAFLNGEEILQKDQEIIERLHRISQHKREMPPYPKI